MEPRQARSVVGIVALCFVTIFDTSMLAQSNMGTWTVNLARSTYSPDPPPKRATLTIAAAGVTVEIVPATGAAQRWTYGGAYDGKPVPVAGNPNADMVSRKRLNPTTTESTFTKSGKVTSVNTSVVAADGKSMTITAKGVNAQGAPMLNVQVYDKK